MNVLLIGSGGREHALAWKLSQSKRVTNLFIAPGNPGTAACGKNLSLGVNDFEAIADAILGNEISMLIVGPEDPLVNGIVNYLARRPDTKHVSVIGPDKAGAQLEGSKEFSKNFMERHQIPTARFKSFTPETIGEGKDFLKTLNAPYVLKASGLAAGKGVVIPETIEEAESELEEMLGGKFGLAGNVVVIEEFMKGIECSVFVLSDGENYVILPEAKDYKRIGEKDSGLNTGGMGAVSPVPFYTNAFSEKVKHRIIEPTIKGLLAEGIDYKGFIFIGIMNVNNEPFVVEYNCRMGDPETEVVIPRIENDLMELFEATAAGKLSECIIRVSEKTAVTVVTVSGGYPGNYEKGKLIHGLEKLQNELVFHSGTLKTENGFVTNGGRVLAFTSLDNSLESAIANSYKCINQICYDGIYYRKDIGKDILDLQHDRTN
jgi:phosphoribosylamine---glycine ligase